MAEKAKACQSHALLDWFPSTSFTFMPVLPRWSLRLVSIATEEGLVAPLPW